MILSQIQTETCLGGGIDLVGHIIPCITSERIHRVDTVCGL